MKDTFIIRDKFITKNTAAMSEKFVRDTFFIRDKLITQNTAVPLDTILDFRTTASLY